MLTIRKEQFDAFASEREKSLRDELLARLRRDLPEHVGAIPDQELQQQVSDGCQAARVLEIVDAEDLFRFLRLRYLPPQVWERPGAQEILVRVLTDTSVDAKRRLQFVEQCIAIQAAPA